MRKEKEMTTESTKKYKLAKLENGKEYITCTYEELHGSGVYTLYYNSIKDVIEYIDVVLTIKPSNVIRAPRKAISIFGPQYE